MINTTSESFKARKVFNFWCISLATEISCCIKRFYYLRGKITVFDLINVHAPKNANEVLYGLFELTLYSKTCVKRPLSKRLKTNYRLM